jgi:hypothetical protein
VTPHNHLTRAGFAAKLVPPDPGSDLAAYDRLPAAVKRALDDAPLAISAVHAFHHLRAHGLVSVLREIKESADLFYAAAERETGVMCSRTPIERVPGRKQCRR